MSPSSASKSTARSLGPQGESEAVSSSPTRRGGIVESIPSSSQSTALSRSKRKLDLIAPELEARAHLRKDRILSSATRVFIIGEKLTEESIDELRVMVIDLGGMNSSLDYATLILTTLRAEKRILRCLDENVLVSVNTRQELQSLSDHYKPFLTCLNRAEKYQSCTFLGCLKRLRRSCCNPMMSIL
jgi:hypothetical protein